MKKCILTILALVSFHTLGYSDLYYNVRQEQSLAIATSAKNYHRMSLGLRGGASIPMGGKGISKPQVGLDGAIDIQYVLYMRNQKRDYYGFLTGVSVDFQHNGMKYDTLRNTYTSKTDGGKIDYNIQAQGLRETFQQLCLEIPLMFSLRTSKGFFMNIGPRVVFPLWNRSMVSCSKTDINAYFVEEGVNVRNEQITGKTDGSTQQVEWKAPVLSLKVGAELGREWRMKGGNCFGLGAYVDWVCPFFFSSQPANTWISITDPSNDGPAIVTYHSPTASYVPKMNAINAGMKLSFHFQLIK